MKPKIIVWYDVEDYINPESNDALLGLIDMMDSLKIRGTFKIVGEKIRLLKNYNRQNIIDKLQNHDIGFHTDLHSFHPTVSEYCEMLSFSDGAKEFEAREKKGYEDLIKILKRPVSTYGQAGAAWAPHVFPVLNKWAIPSYIDSIDIINLDNKPFWYCGILMMIHTSAALRMEIAGPGLAAAKKNFERMLACNVEYISVFYHPCEFIVKEFWDAMNFKNGINTSPQNYKRSALHSKEFMLHHIKQFEDFLSYLKSRGAVFITASDFSGPDLSGVSGSRRSLSSDDVLSLARKWQEEIGFALHKGIWYCASEIFSLLAAYVLEHELKPELLFGPDSEIKTDENAAAKVSDFKKALRVCFPEVMGIKQFPDCFVVNGYKINPTDMAASLCKIIVKGLPDEETIKAERGNFTPSEYVNPGTDWGKSWVIFDKSFDASNIVEATKLQTWTLKPA